MTNKKHFQVAVAVQGEIYRNVQASSPEDARRIVEDQLNDSERNFELDSISDASILHVSE